MRLQKVIKLFARPTRSLHEFRARQIGYFSRLSRRNGRVINRNAFNLRVRRFISVFGFFETLPNSRKRPGIGWRFQTRQIFERDVDDGIRGDVQKSMTKADRIASFEFRESLRMTERDVQNFVGKLISALSRRIARNLRRRKSCCRQCRRLYPHHRCRRTGTTARDPPNRADIQSPLPNRGAFDSMRHGSIFRA